MKQHRSGQVRSRRIHQAGDGERAAVEANARSPGTVAVGIGSRTRATAPAPPPIA